MLKRWIPRGEAGTKATLENMARVAYEGKNVALAVWLGDSPDTLDGTIRLLWNYIPDGPVETIRTIARMQREFDESRGRLFGDCDDAATLAVAALLSARERNPDIGLIDIVAVRPASSQNFEHVFVVFASRGQAYIIDPTAPENADYADWEKFVWRV